MTKDSLRQQFRAIRSAISDNARRESAAALEAALTPYIQNSEIKTIAAYYAVKDETDTSPIIKLAIKNGKRLCMPAWNKDEKIYSFYEYQGEDSLVPGPMQIPEPTKDKPVPIKDIDLFLVPGLAFDIFGNRLGYGGGWYDRFLSEARSDAVSFAYCYKEQISPVPLPHEEHDIKISVIPWRIQQ